MGIIEGGNIRGRVGNRIYYVSNGKQCVRMAGRPKPATLKQLSSQQGIKVVVDFLKPILPFIKVGFGVDASQKKKVAYHLAVGANKKYALKGGYPEIAIDYEKAILSIGTLTGLTNASAGVTGSIGEGFLLQFNWTVSPEDREWPRCNDQVMLMAYFPGEEKNDPAYYKTAGAKRSAGHDELDLPGSMSGKSMELYISVISEDRKEIADSKYLGLYQIPLSLPLNLISPFCD